MAVAWLHHLTPLGGQVMLRNRRTTVSLRSLTSSGRDWNIRKPFNCYCLLRHNHAAPRNFAASVRKITLYIGVARAEQRRGETQRQPRREEAPYLPPSRPPIGSRQRHARQLPNVPHSPSRPVAT